jgi:hypothetical protein
MRNDTLYFYGAGKQVSDNVTEDKGKHGNRSWRTESSNSREQACGSMNVSGAPSSPEVQQITINLFPKYITHKRGTTASRTNRVANHGGERTAIRPLI